MTKNEYDNRIKAFKKSMNRLPHKNVFITGIHGYRSGAPNFNISNRKIDFDNIFCAVKYFPEKDVLLAWDLVRRKKHNGTLDLHISIKWEDISLSKYTGCAHYCSFINRGTKEAYWDKIVVVGEYLFDDFFQNYKKWLAFNSDDKNFPSELKQESDATWLDKRERKKYAAVQKERDASFRQAVLEAYDYHCAICQCDIRELLQAAHLHGHEVAYTGLNEDRAENGICLCANHHLMYDSDLIDLDLEKAEVIVCDKRANALLPSSKIKRPYSATK